MGCMNLNNYLTMQDGAPGVLDIFRLSGSKLSRKKDWRRQVFQIKDHFLKYSRQDVVGSYDLINYHILLFL